MQTYATPAVGISSAPERAAAIIASLRGVVPEGETPRGPALGGARAQARRGAVDHPGRQVVAVLATDGFPTVRAPDPIADRAGLSAAAAQADRPVKTFVVGVFSNDDLGHDGQARLDELAFAGGTERASVVETGGDVSLGVPASARGHSLQRGGVHARGAGGRRARFRRGEPRADRAPTAASRGSSAPLTRPAASATATAGDDVRDERGTPTQLEVCPALCTTLQRGQARVDP